jgi:F0F1-type ATP synthase assembly protein I
MESDEQNDRPAIEVHRAHDKEGYAAENACDYAETEGDREPFILQNTGYSPVPFEETARRSGLAWSMGIVFFTSIAFMLFLGWIADILLGSKPWGLVGGIILGAIIGFIQFFRISSQIYAKPDEKSSAKTLFKDDGE